MRSAFDAPEQVRAGINMTYTALLATVYYVVKSVVDPTILPNAGLARPLTITAPHGSILNCAAPAAVNGRLQTCQRVADMILGALAQAVPERVMACSNSACTVAYFIGKKPRQTARPGSISRRSAAAAARARIKDGLDGVHVHTTNTSNLPVEALEIEYPLTLMRYELVDGLGRRRPPSRRHGPAPRLPGDARLPRARRPHAPAARRAGACSAAVPARTARSRAGRASCSTATRPC